MRKGERSKSITRPKHVFGTFYLLERTLQAEDPPNKQQSIGTAWKKHEKRTEQFGDVSGSLAR